MERLTKHWGNNYVATKLNYDFLLGEPIEDKDTDAFFEIIKKLAHYEDLEEQGLLLREEDVLKFYYCESENKYLVGKRVDTMYYAEVGKTGLCFIMSRYLPWGEHVVAPHTLWKEHTYPSEPKEIPFFDWLQGYIKQLNSKAEAEKALAEMEK